jgi:hypothetical protein
MTDEPFSYGTILNSRDDYIITLKWVLMADHVEETTEENVATPEVHQRGEDVLSLPA